MKTLFSACFCHIPHTNAFTASEDSTQHITLHITGHHQRSKHGSWKSFLEMTIFSSEKCVSWPEEDDSPAFQLQLQGMCCISVIGNSGNMGAFSSKYWHVWLSAIRSVPDWPAYFFSKHISCLWEKPEYLEKTKHGRLCRLWHFWLKTSPEAQDETLHRTLLYTSLVLINAGNTAAERLFWRWRAVVWLDVAAVFVIQRNRSRPSFNVLTWRIGALTCWCLDHIRMDTKHEIIHTHTHTHTEISCYCL